MFYKATVFILIFCVTLVTAQSNSTTCRACKDMIEFITYELNNNNSTLYDLITLIKDVCSRIFGPGGRECVLIVDNIYEIIQMITNHTNSTQICRNLFLC